MYTNIKHNNAFTLVELAIVLVIIGLLVGGVVGGQSLIESAKNKTIISDIAKYKTAVKAFQLEYSALPGDMKDATLYWGKDASACNGDTGTAATDGRQTCNGDNDKTFDYVFSPISNSPNEPWRAWQHLSNSEIIPGKYTGASIGGCTNGNHCPDPGVNAPKGSIEGSTWILLHMDAAWTFSGKNQSRNIIALGNSRNLTGDNRTGMWFGSVLTPKKMKAIDDKTDDGIASSGKITNMNAKTSPGQENPNCTISSAGILSYKLTETSVACVLYADID